MALYLHKCMSRLTIRNPRATTPRWIKYTCFGRTQSVTVRVHNTKVSALYNSVRPHFYLCAFGPHSTALCFTLQCHIVFWPCLHPGLHRQRRRQHLDQNIPHLQCIHVLLMNLLPRLRHLRVLLLRTLTRTSSTSMKSLSKLLQPRASSGTCIKGRIVASSANSAPSEVTLMIGLKRC